MHWMGIWDLTWVYDWTTGMALYDSNENDCPIGRQ